uniref:Uncharacterized protein n=1 Tax=Oryza sativa subsp. japonica TaxID=39947 RepID=Q67WY9_ORYSJ|nr:hypothetical protein [Oryza sativa Japonica Group]
MGSITGVHRVGLVSLLFSRARDRASPGYGPATAFLAGRPVFGWHAPTTAQMRRRAGDGWLGFFPCHPRVDDAGRV